MKRTIGIVIAVVLLTGLYWHQHIQPVHDPKVSPLFRETLNRSLNKFKENESKTRAQAQQWQGNKKTGQAAGLRTAGINHKHVAVPQAAQPEKKNGTLTPPDIKIAGSPQKGRKDAAITIIEFTDFNCIHCSEWAKTLDEVVKEFPNKVTLVFKHFPSGQKPWLPALATLAAGEQGRFWEMQDLIFRNQKAVGMENLLLYAEILRLDIPEFQNALQKETLTKMIEQDMEQGKRLGITGLPTTFVNGMRIKGTYPLSYVRELVRKMLEEH